MRKLFATLALTAAALAAAALPAAAAGSASAPPAPSAPAALSFSFVTAKQCTDAGGKVVPGASITGQVCQGGTSDGAWVVPDFPSGGTTSGG